MFEADAQRKGLTFVYEASEYRPCIDALVLMRIATNLVSNAIKYTQKGQVTFGLYEVGEKVRLEVHDTGIGMSKKEFGTSLARSVRLPKSADKTEGNGYGLAIVKDLADQHNLRLSLSDINSPGTGVLVEF